VDELSSITNDSVQFYWDMICPGTAAEGARLHFERRPTQLACQACGETVELESGLRVCACCGSEALRGISEPGLRLVSIEVQDASGVATTLPQPEKKASPT
jgi:hydrogenase nickel incorporation protein HypA/HybF